jgi:DUF4097 and DUF4098 domain-containing protein YvlB
MASRTRETDPMPSRQDPSCAPPQDGPSGLPKHLLDGIRWSDRAEAVETLHIDAPIGGAIRVRNANGRTRISGDDRSDIEVTAHKAARAESSQAAQEMLNEIRLVLRESPDGLELEVEVPRRSSRHGSANLCIRLPRQLQVAIDAENGRVDVEGIRGAVRARSSNGCAIVMNVVGDVEVSTTNARVCCSGISGRLTARSSNGKIEIEQHQGSVDASTSNGLIRAALTQLGRGGIQLATSNGGIVLDLPDAIDADVDMRADNGTIRNERALDAISRESIGRIVGRLGAGGAPIKLRTSNGSISVH